MRRILVPERADWREKAEQSGFTFHTIEGRPYWDESAALSFSLREIEDDIEAPTAELEEMALAFVDRAIRDESILRRLAIPEAFFPSIAASWEKGERNLYGRFDFAYAGNGPAKLLEYNADTPTGLLETGYFQWLWLEEQVAAGVLPKGADQFNSLHERLVSAIAQLRNGERFHLHLAAMNASDEDRATIGYLAEIAGQAGMGTTMLDIAAIGLDETGRFVDEDKRYIDVLFKLYPWEWMLREDFGRAVPLSKTQFIEPLWKAVLSNKGVLPYLWAMAPGHPNLLPAYFEGDPRCAELAREHVRKPLYSREGANVTLVRDGAVQVHGEGPYGEEGYVIQAAAPLANLGGGHLVLGSWVVASQPAGMLVREDASPVTGDGARFLPHFIEP